MFFAFISVAIVLLWYFENDVRDQVAKWQKPQKQSQALVPKVVFDRVNDPGNKRHLQKNAGLTGIESDHLLEEDYLEEDLDRALDISPVKSIVEDRFIRRLKVDTHDIGEAELTSLRERKKTLQSLIDELNQKVVALSQPLTGDLGDQIEEVNKKKEGLLTERDQVRSKMNYATRRLAVWYGRKKRLKTEGELQLAAEVAASSETVRNRRLAFENVTYQYLKENDRLSYNPGDSNQKMKVNKLLKERKMHLRLLRKEVREAIEEELRGSDHLISDLTLRRDQVEAEIVKIQEEERFLNVLMGNDQEAKDKLKIEVSKRRDMAEAEIQELKALLLEGSPEDSQFSESLESVETTDLDG